MPASLMTAVLVTVGCTGPTRPQTTKEANNPCGPCAATVTPASGGVVDAQTAAALVTLRREEKLAHDVYVTLGAIFDPMPFQRIPHSEVQHAAAMHAVLASHAIADPVEGLPPNRFDDPATQTLYDELVLKGRSDVRSALSVGVEVEELDISGLRAMLASNAPDEIKAVVTQLERASQNHLRAFHRNLTMRGGTYEPKHLAKADFNAILDGPQGAHH